MAITSDMARTTVRSTFALDPETASALGGLAVKWGVSKSEALRRIVRTASMIEDADAAADSLVALREIQERLELTPEKMSAWLREAKALRKGPGP